MWHKRGQIIEELVYPIKVFCLHVIGFQTPLKGLEHESDLITFAFYKGHSCQYEERIRER